MLKFNPAIIALTTGSLMITLFAVYATLIGMQIIQGWDIRSGSEKQLLLERKTYLISTILSNLFFFQLLSLFLFVFTADRLHGYFVGAMCAAGSLDANEYGYPTLINKMATFFLCGIWLVINHTDNRAFDYPLVRTKYRLLGAVAAMMVMETALQTGYFLSMKAKVITSCCGTLFDDRANTLLGDLGSLPSYATKIFFYLGIALTLRTGIHFLVTGRGARAFSGFAGGFLVLSIVSVISFISVHFYELPTHHCPFCLLQGEYHYVGYPLYLLLFTGGGTGMSVGVLDRFISIPSLQSTIPGLQRRCCAISLAAYVLFVTISTYPIIFSDFKLEGY